MLNGLLINFLAGITLVTRPLNLDTAVSLVWKLRSSSQNRARHDVLSHHTAWEQQPTPPVTPEMSPKQRGNAPLPRQQGSSQQQPKSPHWGKLYKMAQECSNEEDESDDPFTTASQTTPISPYKDKGVDRRYSGQASSSLRPASSFSPTKYATPSTGARGLVRAATEGDLQPSYEELLRKMERMQGQLDERQEQIEKREAQIQTLIEENAILRRGSTLFETPSQRQLFPPSPTKSSSQVCHPLE